MYMDKYGELKNCSMDKYVWMSARLIGNYKWKIKSKFGLNDSIIVTINDTLDAIVQLDADSRAMLLEILQKR